MIFFFIVIRTARKKRLLFCKKTETVVLDSSIVSAPCYSVLATVNPLYHLLNHNIRDGFLHNLSSLHVRPDPVLNHLPRKDHRHSVMELRKRRRLRARFLCQNRKHRILQILEFFDPVENGAKSCGVGWRPAQKE